MAYGQGNASGGIIARVGLPIVACTAVLTLGFFGVLALATEQAPRLSLRIPMYVFGAAVTFVAAIVGLDRVRRDGLTILAAAAGIGIAAFGILLLGGEARCTSPATPSR